MSDRSFPNKWSCTISPARPPVQKPTNSEVIELAWWDDTKLDNIELQTGLTEKEVIKLMRSNLKPSSFKNWRKRVSGRTAKDARLAAYETAAALSARASMKIEIAQIGEPKAADAGGTPIKASLSQTRPIRLNTSSCRRLKRSTSQALHDRRIPEPLHAKRGGRSLARRQLRTLLSSVKHIDTICRQLSGRQIHILALECAIRCRVIG